MSLCRHDMNHADCADCRAHPGAADGDFSVLVIDNSQATEPVRAELRTAAGTVVTEEMLDEWVAEAERGYDVNQLRERGVTRGRR